MVDDVVGLPFTRFAAGVNQWSMLFINCCRLAVIVGLVFIRVEHLDLIAALQIDAAVAAALARSFNFGRRSPFHVQLAISESLFGQNTSCAIHCGDSILDLPVGWSLAFRAF